VNQIVGRLSLLIGRRGFGIQNVKADVPLDHLGHQSVHGASASGNVMQNIGTLSFLLERSCDRLYLASDSPNSIEQLLFLFNRVSHKNPDYGLDKDTPPGIA